MKSEKKPVKKATKTAVKTATPKKAASPVKKPKTAAKPKKAALKIPAILLEGDNTPPPQASGPGRRYALGPSALAEPVGLARGASELPEAYGTQRLLLTARDPYWLYASWDLTRDQLKKHNSLSRDGHLVLRLYINSARGTPINEIHVHPESRHWFVHAGRGSTRYVAELGYYSRKGEWVTVSHSKATLTPPDTLSEDTSVRFTTIPIEIPFRQLVELVKDVVRESTPLVEAIQELRAAEYPALPDKKTAVSTSWTPAQEKALAEVVSMDMVRRVWVGSLEITELIRRKLVHEISSATAAQFSQPVPLASGISSISSPFGGMEKNRGFWFNVNAELIIYGATEPSAEVTIGGRVIKLRSDGSFSYRFALPDGSYDLPITATSEDKAEARHADLKFNRSTDYAGEVGVHPQDSALKPPLAENVA